MWCRWTTTQRLATVRLRTLGVLGVEVNVGQVQHLQLELRGLQLGVSQDNSQKSPYIGHLVAGGFRLVSWYRQRPVLQIFRSGVRAKFQDAATEHILAEERFREYVDNLALQS